MEEKNKIYILNCDENNSQFLTYEIANYLFMKNPKLIFLNDIFIGAFESCIYENNIYLTFALSQKAIGLGNGYNLFLMALEYICNKYF